MDWLTEARIAILVALASAAFSGGQFIYTRRLAKNDTLKMKRKAPVLEARFMDSEDLAGWQECHIVVRNLEPVSVDLVSLAVKSKGMRILADGEQFKRKTGSESQYGRALLTASELPLKQAALLNKRLMPVGSRVTGLLGHGDYAADTTSLMFLTQGVKSVRDLQLGWAWSDGQAR